MKNRAAHGRHGAVDQMVVRFTLLGAMVLALLGLGQAETVALADQSVPPLPAS